jgi:CHAT domain-containing protein
MLAPMRRPFPTRLAQIIVVLLVPRLVQAQGEAPLAIEHQAQMAVEHDSVTAWRARWAARLAADAAGARGRAARLGLALLHEFTYEYPEAARDYAALTDTSAVSPDRYTAYAQVAWARMDDGRGAVGDAIQRLDAARALARRVNDSVSAGIAAAAQTFLRANMYSMDAGMATLDTAERLVPRALDGVWSDLRRRRATLLAVQIDPRARALSLEAIQLARRAGDRRAEANAFRALALYHKMRGFPDSNVAALRITADLQRAAGDRRALAETLVRIADVQLTERRLGSARTTLLEVQRESEASHNDYALAAGETGLGDLALRVHDLPSAERHLARAAELNVAANDSASLTVVRNYQVNVLVDAGWLDSAETIQRDILAHFERSREITDIVMARRMLATIAMARGDLAVAGDELDVADSLVRHHHIPGAEAGLWYDRARLEQLRGHDADAAKLLERYLGTLREDDGVARWDVQVRLAEIEARTGVPSAAAARLARASEALERWREVQSDSTLRLLAFQATAHEQGDRDAYFARAIATLAARGENAAAFEQAERRRARTLAERMVQAEVLRSGRGVDSARHASAIEVPRATAASVSRALPGSDVALLEYVTGARGAPTTLFVTTRTRVRAVTLASADTLLPALRRLLAAIESGDAATALARTLGDALLAPALDSLGPGVTRLVIVPDGALHRVPFDALRLADGRAVLERYEISLAPSAAVATLLWRRATARGPARVLAFGDPAFNAERARRELQLASRGARTLRGGPAAASFARLPESGREARIAASYGTSSVARLREEATAAYLKHAPLDSFRVLHFATHALVDERSLLRSAVVLAPTEGDDGLVSPGDLAALSLGADLVVLSACRSAGGVVVDGEGVQGLTAPLLAAGAQAVVATAWPIDDHQTVAVIEDFYRALSRGATVGSALREAKLAAMRRGAPVRDWASFAVIGDATMQVPLKPPAQSRKGVVVTLVVALLGGGVLWFASRRQAGGHSQPAPSSSRTANS